MGSLSIWHLLILLAVVLVLFGGRGKISNIMGDFAQGINAFKKGLKDDKSEDLAKAAPETRKPETIERS
ncbi:MAG TPA: twin-arginine translocase TatA/TatE family subunit [Dongiaceae bacterium]|jgi:sec-independent protein translocase protein TatA|nr:twin-arginine translocase TatA/TatE family subunit [Dongiaceae bacterium]